MARSERWATTREKKKVLSENSTGPVLYYESGKYFTHDKEGHVVILGESGTGKTRREIDSMVIAGITAEKKESFVIADPKGEIYRSTVGFASDEYDIYKFDFRNLYKTEITCWNPLTAPYELWKSGTPENVFRAEQMVEELSHAMYPVVPNTDPFWVKEARNVFLATVYILFSYAQPEEVNLTSVYYLIAKGEMKFGGSNYLKEFVNLEEHNENIAMQLQSYVTTANETRGGIRSVFLEGLSIATKSESVRGFLSNDDIHINKLSGDKPVLIYVILPDESPIYDELAGNLINQLMNHFIYIAESKWGGKLPIRMNFCLDELGNIGRAISNLPHLLSAGRSRNVRVELVLQSISQLDDIYGKSNATTIMSNAAVKIAFRVNHWDTLSELSRLCGEREVVVEGNVRSQPLITPSQLGAMDVGQALIMISGRTKFITWLPDYTDIFSENRMVRTQKCISNEQRKKTQVFDIQKYVKEKKKQKIYEMMNDKTLKDSVGNDSEYLVGNRSEINEPSRDFDIQDFVEKMKTRINEFEEERITEVSFCGLKEEAKREKENKYTVTILSSVSKVKDIKILKNTLNCTVQEAFQRYKEGEKWGEVELKNLTFDEAVALKEGLREIGDDVTIT